MSEPCRHERDVVVHGALGAAHLEIQRLEAELADWRAAQQRLWMECDNAVTAYGFLEVEVAEQIAKVAERDAMIATDDTELQAKDAVIAERDASIARLTIRLAADDQATS